MNRIEDKAIITEASNLPQLFPIQRMNPIDFKGQGSNVNVTMDLTLKIL